MSGIYGKIGVTKRPGELGVHSLDEFHLSVPDLKVAQKYYSEFGLDVTEEGNALGLYTVGSGHRWGSVTEGPKKRLHHLSFGVFEEDYEPMRRRTEQQGVRLIDAPSGCEPEGFWFQDPACVLVQVRVAEKTSPDVKGEFDMASCAPGVAGAPQRSKAGRVHPQRLSHVLLFSPDVLKSVDFYTRVLGMRLSDRSGDAIGFMHGIHGSDHHLVAFAKSNGPGLHHCSWAVPSVDDIGKGAMRMADRGFQKGWGLGRHVLGSNYFHYVRDPWGSYCEYSADIDYIPCDCDWNSGDYPPEDSFYLWGPDVPGEFVVNYEQQG